MTSAARGGALALLGDLARQEGDIAAARVAYERYLAIIQAVHSQRSEGVALSKLGDLALQEGDIAAARVAYERVLAIMQAVRDQREEGIALVRLADVCEQEGDLVSAESYYRNAIALMLRMKSAPDVADTQFLLGRFLAQHRRGEPGEARRMLEQAEAVYARLGHGWERSLARVRDLLGQLG